MMFLPKKSKRDVIQTNKYTYIYKVIINNINQLTKGSEIDVTRDESSWSTASLSEAGVGVTFLVMEKP